MQPNRLEPVRMRRAPYSQGELRSHGFFYRADGADAGVLGLPVREARRPGYTHLVEGSASILFLRRQRPVPGERLNP